VRLVASLGILAVLSGLAGVKFGNLTMRARAEEIFACSTKCVGNALYYCIDGVQYYSSCPNGCVDGGLSHTCYQCVKGSKSCVYDRQYARVCTKFTLIQ
jgi:hypothetical protein